MPDMPDLTIGGLRMRAIGAMDDMEEISHRLLELEYVKTMALIQIAQEMNEIKVALRHIQSDSLIGR